MEKKDLIVREDLQELLEPFQDSETIRVGTVRKIIKAQDSADVVAWSWLEQYATGKRCNYASEFVYEARKEWENGKHDSD